MQSSDTDYHFDNNNTIDMDFCANMEIQTKKRKFEMTTENVTSAIMSGRQFVLLPRNNSTYVTTDWKLTGTSLFLPLKGDTFVNLQKYEQITVADGSYFIADDAGNYSRSVTGKVLHLWKYCMSEKDYFVAESFLFTSPQDFSVIINHLYTS
ncbi:Hypothetical predicted protein [Mytilus galloprovincialis]|uniref:Uncharacterized protein n=1 Tax=Mytilus galloprovincialis TaxID=29158 RepID=A0A8B6F4W5_MYTGA|nr:Hypothetical predicted protein [Mytilus galloprovincialis]